MIPKWAIFLRNYFQWIRYTVHYLLPIFAPLMWIFRFVKQASLRPFQPRINCQRYFRTSYVMFLLPFKEPLKPDVPPSSSSWPVRSRSSDRAASSSLIRSRRSLFSAAEEQENRARAQRVLALKPAFARGSQSDDLGETSQRSISR